MSATRTVLTLSLLVATVSSGTISTANVIEPNGRDGGNASQPMSSKVLTTVATKNASYSLDDLLEIWDPWVLLHRWSSWVGALRDPSLSHMGASPDDTGWRRCSSDIADYLEALHQGLPWATHLSDASGRAPKGVFWGNRYWIGSRELCDHLDSSVLSAFPKISTPPFRLKFSVAALSVNINISTLEWTSQPIIGLCLPASCDRVSVHRLLQSSVASSPIKNRTVKIRKVRQLGTDYDLLTDPVFIGLLTVSALVAALALIATIYDAIRASSAEPVWGKILLAFSVRANMAKLLSCSMADESVASLHGIRFLSLLWVMLAHASLIVFHLADNQRFRELAERQVLYQILSSGGLSVDTFFFISGFLASFLYFRSSSGSPDESLFSGVKPGVRCFRENARHFAAMMAYRLVRLTPSYVAMLAVVTTSMRWLQTNVVADLPFPDAETCPRFWWRNALYINTFYPSSERCMAWSWYLANDTQLYLLGTLLLVLASSHFWLSTGVLSVLLVCSWLTSAAVSVATDHITSFRDPFAHYDQLYDKPWVRAGPHLIGLVTGWLIWRAKPWLSGLSWATLTAGWTIAAAAILTCMFGLYGDQLGPALSAAHSALSHTAWGLAIAWVLVTCASGRAAGVNAILAWRPLYPLSRLCYCAYLVHPQLMRIVLLLADSSLHISRAFIGVLFIGFTAASFVAALLLSLLFEAPFVALFRVIQPRSDGQNKTSSEDGAPAAKKIGSSLPNSWSIVDFPY